MFVDAVLPNLLLFALGQGASWYYLRTGRVPLGLAATIVLWLLLDWWLVARYLFAADRSEQWVPVLLMQAAAIAIAGWLVHELVRRRRGRPRRAARFRAAMVELLGGRWHPARDAFRQLVRTDPWDAAAWLAWGDVERQLGNPRGARRCWQHASAVDSRHEHRDLLRWRLREAPAGTADGVRAADGRGSEPSVPAGARKGGAPARSAASKPARTG